MAEKKRPTITNAAGYEEAKAAAQQGIAAPTGNATGLRIGAIVLWVLAVACEIVAILVIFGKINITFLPTMWTIIILLVLDLAFVIIGAQLWKKANHIKPASEKNKTLFWIWNNMGVIVAVFAFLPLIILMLSNKNLDKKTKVVCVVAAVIAAPPASTTTRSPRSRWRPRSRPSAQRTFSGPRSAGSITRMWTRKPTTTAPI